METKARFWWILSKKTSKWFNSIISNTYPSNKYLCLVNLGWLTAPVCWSWGVPQNTRFTVLKWEGQTDSLVTLLVIKQGGLWGKHMRNLVQKSTHLGVKVAEVLCFINYPSNWLRLKSGLAPLIWRRLSRVTQRTLLTLIFYNPIEVYDY